VEKQNELEEAKESVKALRAELAAIQKKVADSEVRFHPSTSRSP
jgi:predicted  nucleic acid-binding Zn-ribbon protein